MYIPAITYKLRLSVLLLKQCNPKSYTKLTQSLSWRWFCLSNNLERLNISHYFLIPYPLLYRAVHAIIYPLLYRAVHTIIYPLPYRTVHAIIYPLLYTAVHTISIIYLLIYRAIKTVSLFSYCSIHTFSFLLIILINIFLIIVLPCLHMSP